VEIFINPTHKNIFYGFEVNALGYYYDFKEHYKVKSYKKWLQKALKLLHIYEGRYFSVEIAILSNVLAKTERRSTWKAAIYRIDYNKAGKKIYGLKRPSNKIPLTQVTGFREPDIQG